MPWRRALFLNFHLLLLVEPKASPQLLQPLNSARHHLHFCLDQSRSIIFDKDIPLGCTQKARVPKMFEGLPCIDWEEELPDEYPALPKREDYANEKRHEFKLQYWENNKEEWQLRKLRELYVKTMERIWPDWVAYFKKIENWARHDLYMAVISCDNTWCLNRLNAWLDESEKLERWEEYQPLVQF